MTLNIKFSTVIDEDEVVGISIEEYTKYSHMTTITDDHQTTRGMVQPVWWWLMMASRMVDGQWAPWWLLSHFALFFWWIFIRASPKPWNKQWEPFVRDQVSMWSLAFQTCWGSSLLVASWFPHCQAISWPGCQSIQIGPQSKPITAMNWILASPDGRTANQRHEMHRTVREMSFVMRGSMYQVNIPTVRMFGVQGFDRHMMHVWGNGPQPLLTLNQSIMLSIHGSRLHSGWLPLPFVTSKVGDPHNHVCGISQAS